MSTGRKPLPLRPDEPTLLSHLHTIEGEEPRRKFIVSFDYPDCVRTFDGQTWTVTPYNLREDQAQ